MRELTSEDVKKQIASLLNNTDKEGGELFLTIVKENLYSLTLIIYLISIERIFIVILVIIHYIGHGKKMTGDWCFSDGFITLRELLDLYMSNTHFKGQVLNIISDCSYSGSWVKECMEFMDEQGVGPCGHAAKDKGILVKVYASGLSNEIPMEFAFSTHCANNDKNLGTMSCVIDLRSEVIHEGQHPSGLDLIHWS